MRSTSPDLNIETVATSEKRSQLVIAAAGSGKTKLLVDVLGYRLAHGIVDPSKQQVVVFTFTNNAADELVVRLSSLLDSLGRRSAMNNIYIGTIHSWCSEFLKDTGVLANTKIVDELEQTQVVQRVYPILALDRLYAGKNQFRKIEQFLADLELYDNELLDITSKEIPKNVRLAIESYQKFMQSQRLLDFGSLIREATSRVALAKGRVRPFDVYVDEYQDVNPAQVRLLQVMSSSHTDSRLLAVGDPRQAIYQWRGGDVSRTFKFTQDFPGSEIHELYTNYRSRTGIVQLANIVARDMKFPSNFKISDMRVGSARADEAVSAVSDVDTFPNEDGVVQLVKQLMGEGVRPSDIAVLMRSVLTYGQGLMDRFDAEGIPYFSPNRNAGTRFVQEFMLSIIELIELMGEPPNPANQAELQELEERIENAKRNISKYSKTKDAQKTHESVSVWYKELTRDVGKPRNERYNFRQQLFNFCDSIGLKIAPQDIEIQEGFSAITQIMRAIEEAYRRRYLQGYHVRASPWDVFVHNLRWELEHQLDRWYEVGMNISRSNAVTISTVHAAKGLEWPVVIVPYLWNLRFPLRASSHGTSFSDHVAARYGTTLEDERRLWYVAVTRARDRFYFFSCPDDRHSQSEFAYTEETRHFKNTMAIHVATQKDSRLSRIESHDRPRYFNIGVSDFLLLLECPYQFYLRKVVGVDVPVGEELGAGNVMHRVIQRIAQGQDPSNLDEIVREEVYLPLGEIEHEQRVRGSVKAKVKRLIRSGILKSIENAEYSFNFPIKTMVVSGVVDATRTVKDSVQLIDWKYSIHKEFEPRYENQLRVYAYGMRYCGVHVQNAILYDLSDRGKPAEIQVEITPPRTQDLIGNAANAFDRLAMNSPFTTPSEVACLACDVSQICPDSLRPTPTVRRKRK